jgi:hypothetical protein
MLYLWCNFKRCLQQFRVRIMPTQTDANSRLQPSRGKLHISVQALYVYH